MDIIKFKQELSKIKIATSVTGKKYHIITVNSESVIFRRENKPQSEKISIAELYQFFTKENNFNTTTAKKYISGRVQSPSVAILKQLKSPINNQVSTEVNVPRKVSVSEREAKLSIQYETKTNDETYFFRAFSEIVGESYLLSKSIGKPINKGNIFLSNNYKDYLFEAEIDNFYSEVLDVLKSNFLFSSESLSHYVDGLIVKHPQLKTRIVEFDEEQHFTPARMASLKEVSKIIINGYTNNYIEICSDAQYFNDEVLKKNRIKSRLKKIPETFEDFLKWLESLNEKESGYICSKNGFNFLGGRIAQRAYYDCLRDTAHLSKKNVDFEPPLRFAKKYFEDETDLSFNLIAQEEIKAIIIKRFQEDYEIHIGNN